jgi:hypothetical protein
MIIEMYTYADRLSYLQTYLEDKIVVLGEPDQSGQVKISIDIQSSIDVMEVFHAGIRYGMTTMQEALTK